MIEALREFAIRLFADVDNKSFKEVSATVDETSKSVSDFASNVIGALTAGAFALAVKETVDKFNALSDAASRMGGVTATELDRIGYVAGRTGSDAETAAESFEELSKMVGEAAIGVGGGVGFFEDYGLQAKKADGTVKTATEVFEELKAKSKDWTESQKSAMLQQAGMDKSLVGLLSADTAEIEKEYDTRTKLLGVNADEMGAMSADFNDHLGRMNRSFSDVLTAVIVRILPPITDAFKLVTKWITYSGDTIVKIIEPFTFVIRTMVRMVNGALIGLSSFIDLFGDLPAYVGLAVGAMKTFNMVMSASPLVKFITLASAVISVIGLLIDDFRTAREGGESFFKFWKEPWIDSFLKAGERLMSFFDHLKGVLFDSGNRVEHLVDAFFELGKAIFRDAWDGLAGGLEHIFKSFFPDAHEAISEFEKAFSEGATAIVNGISDFIDNGLSKIGDKVTSWISGIGDKIKGSFNGVANFFGFGDDNGGGVLDSKYANTAGAIPVGSTAHQAVTNNVNNTVNQSFNVANRETASYIAKDSTKRTMGVAW